MQSTGPKEGGATVYLALPFGEEGNLEGFFLTAQGRGACPVLSHSLGLPEMEQGFASGRRGFVCYLVYFFFFCHTFSPSVMEMALDFPAACSLTSRKTSLGSEGEKKDVLAMRCLTGF